MTPFQAWLPHVEKYEGSVEYSHSDNEFYVPWIVCPSVDAKLDETDPIGVTSAVRRLYFSENINAIGSLNPMDPFKRTWADSSGRVAARSEAWGCNPAYDDDESISAERLVCGSWFLKDVLQEQRAELLILVILRRYDKGFGSRDSQYWHTTAVLRIMQSLNFEFYPGVVNKLHVMKY